MSDRGWCPELQLALALAREANREVVQLWARAADERELARHLNRLRLFGLLGRRLCEASPPCVSPDFRSQVEHTLAAVRADSVHKQAVTWQVVSALERQDVPAMPLKGPFLAERLHGDLGARASADVDVLVHARDMPRAVRVVESLGYRRPRVSDGRPQLHHIFEADGAPELELHWRITWWETIYSGLVLERAQRSREVPEPSTDDELLMLLLFYARDGLVGLKYPVDVAAWLKRHGVDRAQHIVAEVAQAHPRLERPIVAAAMAVDRLLVTSVSRELHAVRRWGLRRAVGLLDWSVTLPEAEAGVTTKVVDGLLTPPSGQIRWLRRALLPKLPGVGLQRALDQLGHVGMFIFRSLPIYLRLLTPGQRDRPGTLLEPKRTRERVSDSRTEE